MVSIQLFIKLITTAIIGKIVLMEKESQESFIVFLLITAKTSG